MPRPSVDEESRRRNVTVSLAPPTSPLIKAVGDFYELTNPGLKWSDGRVVDQAIKNEFLNAITEKLRDRYPEIGFTDSANSGWVLNGRAARVNEISLQSIIIDLADLPQMTISATIPLSIPHIIESLAHFFMHGTNSPRVQDIVRVFPSYENRIDGQQVVVSHFDYATGGSRIIPTLAAPLEPTPPVGSTLIVRDGQDCYEGVVKSAQVVERHAGGRMLFVSVVANEPYT
jgi:hypothetical protein